MAYLNELVNCDTQSVFLGTPTRDALIALSTNSSLTRDPSAPQGLTREQLQRVEDDPELMKLENTRVAFREDLISEYGKISKVTDPAKRDRYRQLGNQVRAERKKLQNQIDKEAYKQYFDNVGNTIIENNYTGGPPHLNLTPLLSCPSEKLWPPLSLRTEMSASFLMRSLWKIASCLSSFVSL